VRSGGVFRPWWTAHPHGDGARAFYRAARRLELAARACQPDYHAAGGAARENGGGEGGGGSGGGSLSGSGGGSWDETDNPSP